MMGSKRSVVGLAAVLILSAASPVNAQSSASSPDQTPDVASQRSIVLPADLDRVLRDYERHWQAGDADALASLFVENGLIVRSGTWIRGRTQIQAAYQPASGQLSLRAIEYAADDELGYIIGAYGYGDEVPIEDRGMFVLTLKRSPGGGWLIVSDLDRGISE
jgi:ketosteroid isomerase-like protein